MERLRLYYPCKPYVVTQAWGVANPSYKQFGFSRHNGEDCREGADKLVHAPLPCRVLDVGFNSGAGNYVRLISMDKWIVEGAECFVWFMVMHLEKPLCKVGDILSVGDAIGVSDHTGFSTGPHVHISYRRVSEYNTVIDTDTTTDCTFDPHPYWTGIAAEDYWTVVHLLQQTLIAATALVAQWKKRSA